MEVETNPIMIFWLFTVFPDLSDYFGERHVMITNTNNGVLLIKRNYLLSHVIGNV